jgi:urate oxidase
MKQIKKTEHMTTQFLDFKTLLDTMQRDIRTEIDGDGIVIKTNPQKYTITRRVLGSWELITLSQYRNSEDLILVETSGCAFTVSRWCPYFTIGEQITRIIHGEI